MILEALLKAIENGKSLRVRYFGGSSPGSERELQPLSVKDGKVRALCFSSGETKTFVVDKMELAIEGIPSALASTLPTPSPVYASVDELLNHQSASLQELGWVVRREGESVSLHRTFKNGKLIQTPDVALQFEAVAYDLIFDGEQVVEANHRDRSRPWVLRAKNKTTKTFGDFAKAQLTFLEFAKSLAPRGAMRNA